MTRRRAWLIASLATGIVGIVILFLTRSPYPFLSRFQGEKRLDAYFVPKGLTCYTFTGDASIVKQSMRRDLLDRQWKLDLDCPDAMVLSHLDRQGKPEKAIYAARNSDNWNSFNVQETATCAVWLPDHATWLETSFQQLSRRLGHLDAARTFDVNPFSDSPVTELRWASMTGNGIVEIQFRNLSLAKSSVTILECDQDDYEPREIMPQAFDLGPREAKTIRFSYPNVPHPKEGQQTLHYVYKSPSLGSGGDSRIGSSNVPELDVVDAGSLNRIAIIRNTHSRRTLEIKDLVVQGRKLDIAKASGLPQVLPRKPLRFPFQLRGTAASSTSFRYRLLPNKEWRQLKWDP